MTKKRKYKNKWRKKKNIIKLNERRNNYRNNDKLYSPQIVATIYKYTIENNLTNKREKKKRRNTHTWTNGMYFTNNIIYMLMKVSKLMRK